MKPLPDSRSAAPVAADRANESSDPATGLPWFRTWRSVYIFVLGSFVIWVGLLFALRVMFS